MPIPWKEVKAKILTNPLVKEEYDRLDKEFQAAKLTHNHNVDNLPKLEPTRIQPSDK